MPADIADQVQLLTDAISDIARIAADKSLAATIKVFAIQERLRQLSVMLAALRGE